MTRDEIERAIEQGSPVRIGANGKPGIALAISQSGARVKFRPTLGRAGYGNGAMWIYAELLQPAESMGHTRAYRDPSDGSVYE